MISLQSGRDLPRRPELLQPRLDLRDQPRTPRELRRFRPPRAPRRPALSPHRPIAPPTTPGPDLPAHRRGRTPQHPGNRPTRLPSRDPTTDPLSLPRRKPEPRMRSPPLQQHRRIPSPLDRPDRNPELRRNPSQPHILPSPRSNPRTLIRPHHPIRLTNTPTLRHQISNLSTQNTNHVALTDGHHPCHTWVYVKVRPGETNCRVLQVVSRVSLLPPGRLAHASTSPTIRPIARHPSRISRPPRSHPPNSQRLTR